MARRESDRMRSKLLVIMTAEPHKVYNPWTHYDDYNKIGYSIVDLLLERQFGRRR
jgi:hypothetical protein